MNIRILGAHNVETSYTRCISMVVDDSLVLDAGGLTSALSIEAQHNIEAILLTHSHYDHIRDIPNIAINIFNHTSLFQGTEQLNVYATEPVREILISHLMDGKIYPDFTKNPPANPTLMINVIEVNKPFDAAGYTVLPVNVNHGISAVGYEVKGEEASFFYTGDTGPGLTECWRKIGTPQVLIIETTFNNEHEDAAKSHGHLTPSLLKQELAVFKEMKGYLPRVFLVHMTPEMEDDIKLEAGKVASELGASITLAYEGMSIRL